MYIPTFADVLAAHERIMPYIHRTPVLTSSYLNGLTGAELYFKCENFQKAAAFKARGASNAVFGLTDAGAVSVKVALPGVDGGLLPPPPEQLTLTLPLGAIVIVE